MPLRYVQNVCANLFKPIVNNTFIGFGESGQLVFPR